MTPTIKGEIQQLWVSFCCHTVVYQNYYYWVYSMIPPLPAVWFTTHTPIACQQRTHTPYFTTHTLREHVYPLFYNTPPIASREHIYVYPLFYNAYLLLPAENTYTPYFTTHSYPLLPAENTYPLFYNTYPLLPAETTYLCNIRFRYYNR